MSDEEYGYYGEKKTTLSKEECTETMQKIVVPAPEDIKYYNLFSEESIHNQLTDDDRKALEDYAPILFNVFNGENLEDAMFGLVKAVWDYRLYQSPHYAINYVKNNNFKRYTKDPKDKIKSFSGHIDSLIELMGGNFSSGTPKDPNMPTPAELKTILKYAKEHSETYLPSKPTVSADKKIFVNEYLTSLKLNDKTDEIEDFVKSIK